MASTLSSALPEHWTELNSARRQRHLCSEDVAGIKKSCEADHGTRHVAECQDCFPKVLDRMFSRFKDSQDREWFSERRAVVFGLETMFAEAKEQKCDITDIEASIGSEKEAWYRWVLRRYPEFLAVAESGVDQDEVRSILDDPDRCREELVAMVGQAVGMPGDWSSQVDAFVEKVAAADGDAAALKRLYTETFFKDHSTGNTLENAQGYLNTYESSSEVSLEDIVGKIISANRADRSSQAQRDTHQGRLDELRRAKTAFEQNKKQAKSQQQGVQAPAADIYYSLPPCSVCQKSVDPADVISCPICQMISQMGGDKALVLYCSEECRDKGFGGHVEQSHACEAGSKCVQEGDEDEAMEDESAGAVACNECLDEKQATLFCSFRCAESNLAAHRKRNHGAGTAAGEARNLTSQVDRMIGLVLSDEKTGLKFRE